MTLSHSIFSIRHFLALYIVYKTLQRATRARYAPALCPTGAEACAWMLRDAFSGAFSAPAAEAVTVSTIHNADGPTPVNGAPLN